MQKPVFTRKLSLAAMLVVAANTAAAQERANLVLEEVLVTAQKRTESLTDVPISIAVMSSEALRKTGVRQMHEVAEFIPNMSISSGNDSSTAVRIRGVGATTRNIGFDTRVGVYVDGIYMGQSPGQNVDILDLERVEVARGPQGTLFGKNTVAGAINLITTKPSDELELEVTGEMGNLNSRRFSVISNIPLGDNAAARFSVVDHKRDGFVRNITTGTDFNERDSTAWRGQLAFGGERFDVNIAGDYMDSERVSFFGTAVSDWSGSVPNTESPGRLELANNLDNNEEREVWGVSATVNVDLGSDYSLTSITAYRDTFASRQQDTDHSSLNILHVDYPDGYEQLTQEFQIFSPDENRFKYVAGVYLYDEDAKSERRAIVGDLTPLLLAQGSPLAPFGPLFNGASAGTFGTVDTRSWALYINGTYDLTERLTLGFGGRYSDEEREVDYSLVGDIVDLGFVQVPASALFGVAMGQVVNGQPVAPFADKKTYTDFSPSLSLSYALTDDVNVYVKYSEAFKSGGFNVDFVSQSLIDDGIDFDKETVEAWEVGIKGSALDNRLRYNLAAFQMDFEDYQLNQFIQLSNNTSTITIQNAAEVSSRGVEAELTWYPTDNLMLQGAFGYNDAEFDSFPGGASSRNPDGLGADLKGNVLPEAPEVTSAVAIQYNHWLNHWNADLVSRLDWTYSDSFYTTEDNISVANPGSSIPFGKVDSYSLLNGRIGVESLDGWSVYLWGRNILDEKYSVTTSFDFLGTVLDFPGDIRTYGVEVSYKFL
jgi:iron complex outermembrane receptor protein